MQNTGKIPQQIAHHLLNRLSGTDRLEQPAFNARNLGILAGRDRLRYGTQRLIEPNDRWQPEAPGEWSRATGRRSAIVSKPKRRHARSAEGASRKAATGSGANASAVAPEGARMISPRPYLARACAAPPVSATAIRAEKPARRQKA
ncbi:hypothetical protein GCM10020258_56820 [Sphingomonas yabuuchiae]